MRLKEGTQVGCKTLNECILTTFNNFQGWEVMKLRTQCVVVSPIFLKNVEKNRYGEFSKTSLFSKNFMPIIGVEERQLVFGKKILWTWDDQVKQFSTSNGPQMQPGSTEVPFSKPLTGLSTNGQPLSIQSICDTC